MKPFHYVMRDNGHQLVMFEKAGPIGVLDKGILGWAHRDGSPRNYSDLGEAIRIAENDSRVRDGMRYHLDSAMVEPHEWAELPEAARETGPVGDATIHEIDFSAIAKAVPILPFLLDKDQAPQPYRGNLWVSCYTNCTAHLVVNSAVDLIRLEVPIKACPKAFGVQIPKAVAATVAGAFPRGTGRVIEKSDQYGSNVYRFERASDKAYLSFFGYLTYEYPRFDHHLSTPTAWSPLLERKKLMASIKKHNKRMKAGTVATVGFIDGKLYIGDDAKPLFDEITRVQTTVVLQPFLRALEVCPDDAVQIGIFENSGPNSGGVQIKSSSFRYLRPALPVGAASQHLRDMIGPDPDYFDEVVSRHRKQVVETGNFDGVRA